VPFVLLVALLSGCGDDDLHVRYEAERHLWNADDARFRLPGRPVGDGRDRWLALAERYESIAGHYESWTARHDVDAPFRSELRDVAGRAWIRAADLHTATGDSLEGRELLTRLIERFAGTPRALDVRLRLGDIALVDGDSASAVDHLRRAWSIARDSTRARNDHIELPGRIAGLSPVRRDPQSTVYTWARDEYHTILRRARHATRVEAAIELADMALDFGDVDSAMDVIERLTEPIRSRWNPAAGDLGTMRRAVELQIRAFGNGAVEFEALRPNLDWTLDHDSRPGRLLTTLGATLEERGELDRALSIYESIWTRYDDALWAPRAMLSAADIYSRRQEWDKALVQLELLESRYSLSEPALAVPLSRAEHLRRRGPDSAAITALEQAERRYEELMERLPRGSHADHLRELLIETLERRGRYREALAQRLAWIDDAAGTMEELHRLHTTLQSAREHRLDDEVVASIERRIADRFPDTRLGRRMARTLPEDEP
jgi:tetratricopeptide (TPR) repeat protein